MHPHYLRGRSGTKMRSEKLKFIKACLSAPKVIRGIVTVSVAWSRPLKARQRRGHFYKSNPRRNGAMGFRHKPVAAKDSPRRSVNCIAGHRRLLEEQQEFCWQKV